MLVQLIQIQTHTHTNTHIHIDYICISFMVHSEYFWPWQVARQLWLPGCNLVPLKVCDEHQNTQRTLKFSFCLNCCHLKSREMGNSALGLKLTRLEKDTVQTFDNSSRNLPVKRDRRRRRLKSV